MLENLDEGIYFVDRERKIGFWNKGAELITGFKAEEIVGKNCADNILNHVDALGCHFCLDGNCPLAKTMVDGERREATVFLHHKQGQRVKVNIKAIPIYGEHEEIVGSVEVFKEDDEKLAPKVFNIIGNTAKENWKELALHDQLTKLPNRRYVETFIKSKISEQELLDVPFGILFMDLDNFRDFNNNYGHEMGDKVLKVVASTMQNGLRKGDMAARWGGEEFICVVMAKDEYELFSIAENVRNLVENSVLREEFGELRVTMSVGATISKKGENLTELIDRADSLMYVSKQNGKNRVTIG